MYLNIRRFLILVFLPLAVFAQSSESESTTEEEVTTQEVKNFLDPTIMINSLEYNFQSNFLLNEARLYSHTIMPMWAISHWTALWARVPFLDFSVPGANPPSGLGDVMFGWGVVAREDLKSRLTGTAFWIEALAPTGSVEKGTGVGTWIFAPGGGIALNLTEKFPIYIEGRYLHSLEALGGSNRDEEVEERPDLRIRTVELNLQTVHIMPKGFWVAALPGFTFNFNQDFNFFSLGAGVGRALTRNFAISGAYIHQVAGKKTFNQAFTVGLSFVWGKEKLKGK